MRARYAGTLVALLLAAMGAVSVFVENADAEIAKLREEVKQLRDQVNTNRSIAAAPVAAAVDTTIDTHYGPDAPVTSRTGKLVMGGLIQVWYYSIQNDSRGLFDQPGITGIHDTNAASDNDSFRIRRAEVDFTMEIHENVRAYVMIDPAAEASSFPQLGVAPHSLANLSPEYAAINGPVGGGFTTNFVKSVQEGNGTIPTLLQDALINFHGAIPHHDFSVGQMKTSFNEEAFQYDGSLDFAERSYIGNSNSRDLGTVIHGSWWCNADGGVYQGQNDPGRFQYWLGIYDGAGNLHGTAGPAFNRSDDNDHKDYIATVMLRPIQSDCWGSFEIGASYRCGQHGEEGHGTPASNPVNGLDEQKTWSMGYDGWAKYYAPGAFKGLWFKGEAEWVHDRNPGGTVIDLTNDSFQNSGDQANPYSTFGYWGAAGYKFCDAPWLCNCKNPFWKNFEVMFRYESAPNVTISDPVDPLQTNVYQTKLYTSGINYYLKGQHAKIQLDYNLTKNPHGPLGQPFHNTRNDSLILNFQVMW